MYSDNDEDNVPVSVVDRLIDDADVAQRSGDLQAELHARRELLSIAQQEGRFAVEIMTLRRVGNIHQALGNLRFAHPYRLAAWELSNRHAERLTLKQRVLVEVDLGRSYIEVKDWSEAESHTRHALEDAASIAEPASRQEVESIIETNLSAVFAATGRDDEALSLLQKAHATAEALGDAYLLGLTHLNLAVHYLNNIQLATSEKHAREAYRFSEISRDPVHRAQVQLLLGGIRIRSSYLRGAVAYSPEAEASLQRTLRLAQNLGNPILVAEAEIELALLYESNKQISEAATRFRAALEALEEVRTELGYEQFQLAFFASQQNHYEQAILFQLRNGQPELAFQTMERLRSRLLLTLLGPGRWDLGNWNPEEQAALQEVLRRYGGLAFRRMAGETPGGNGRPAASDSPMTYAAIVEPDDAALSRSRQEFLNLYKRHRAQRVDWLGRQSPPLATMPESQRLVGHDDALISYLCANDGLVISCLTNGGAHFQQLNMSVHQIGEEVAQLSRAMLELQDEALDPFVAEQWFNRVVDAPWPKAIQRRMAALQRRLDRMFALLIAPILPAVAKYSHWIIVPSGPLHRVPWPALHSREGYLVERRTLSLLPSVSVGVALAKAPPAPSSLVVTFGDPDPHHSLFALPASRREVETLRCTFPDSPPPFLGADASKTNFLEWAPRAHLLHLACHHCFDASAPLLSFLKMSGEKGEQFVYAYEIADLELQARLVTLSACESGLSQTATGDEQFGIVRSFLAAGAQGVISTLWSIQDQSASVFFNDFYRRACATSLDRALAETQRRMLSSPQFQLPCFWAPYVLTGNWRDNLAITNQTTSGKNHG